MGVTIVIPTYNMSTYLEPLCQSLLDYDVLALVEEVLIVDDASADATLHTTERIGTNPKIKCLRLSTNQGRFRARLAGAQQALGDWLLFLDSRLTVSPDFAKHLSRALSHQRPTVGWIDIDVTKNIFCLYWQRSHMALFPAHYRHASPWPLSLENYDTYLKGTGVFLCRKSLFLEACARVGSQVLSDDTRLLREILTLDQLWIDPHLRVQWEPRRELWDFLKRFFERGPSFVEYHIFQRPGLYAYVVAAVLVFLLGWLALLWLHPSVGLWALGFLILVQLATVRVFAHNAREAIRLWPLHTMVILFFGLGVLRGLFTQSLRVFRWPR